MVGYFSNKYFHQKYWHTDYWYEPPVIATPPDQDYFHYNFWHGNYFHDNYWAKIAESITPVMGGRKRRKRIDWQAEENDIMAIINTINTFLHIRRH